jgi:hypothetical protein
MNNYKFLERPHFCIVCKSQIDMKKLEHYIFNCMHYEHKPEMMMPPVREDNDPVIMVTMLMSYVLGVVFLPI